MVQTTLPNFISNRRLFHRKENITGQQREKQEDNGVFDKIKTGNPLYLCRLKNNLIYKK